MPVAIFVILIILAISIPFIGLNGVFLALGFLLAFIILKRNFEINKNLYKTPENALHITNVDKGGIFELSGIGKQSENMTLKVLAKHLYQQGDYFWYELECDKGEGDKIWVEVEEDDATNVSIVIEKPKLEDFSSAIKSTLIRHDDEEAGEIKYNGRMYKYAESDSAVFYRYCDDKRPEKFYYWEYVSGNLTLTFEKWSDNDYEIFLSQYVQPHQVRVLSIKG